MVVLPRRYTFKKLFDCSYPIQHIYPIKQKDVYTILNGLPEGVQRVYIFGSSLNLNCGEESDIDVLVVGQKNLEVYKAFSKLFKGLENEVDLIVKTPKEFEENLKDKNSICSIVKEEGLLVYERALCTCTDRLANGEE